MRLVSLELESRLRAQGLWPQSRIVWAALYVLALDFLLFVLRALTQHASLAMAAILSGWIIFLSIVAIVLLAVSAYRWLRSKLLWRLRNRLIVTYVFIGVIPVVLLVMISLITLYLYAGQFASFVVTSDIATHLHGMETANRAIAHHLSTHMAEGGKLETEISHTRPLRPEWSRRQVCAWDGKQTQATCSGPQGAAGLGSPTFISGDFGDIVSDHGRLYLRTASVVTTATDSLRVILSEPLDKQFAETIAEGLGRITFFGTESWSGQASTRPQTTDTRPLLAPDYGTLHAQLFSAGANPAASNFMDVEIPLVRIQLPVVNWETGTRSPLGALALVETRPSVLAARLFADRGEYAKGVEYILWSIAGVFLLIEILALLIGVKLTRSITSAVGQLYEATKHINRADFRHRISVQSSDQLATLATSFNSMTTSIEDLVREQKEKQRLEGELAIAQEVQAQLYPKLITQLDTLEVHGFCRPARTVSGDYYDFVALNSDKLMLAVGDISGKGISAALLMATIHSAVRAYSIEDVPVLREPALVGSMGGSALMLASETRGADTSPATLLALLNHQLYESTPAAKYATLFLAIYDGATRRLTYANGGHLQPILISENGSAQLLDCGGTVVGLFDNLSFPEATVQLRPGDLLVTYSDGVTEPENAYDEFGEERLIQLIRANRHLPLERITEIVTSAVQDWIGDNEQPDDITLVLARAR
ncbi:MAG: SpoIIE family protein phosphatase [Terriglobales bacterium]|jgi:sigma-B regulation protein RsbU (phosphoserine phosphatase)